jgi:hypothetical protein
MREQLHYRVSGQTILVHLGNDYTIEALTSVVTRALSDPETAVPALLLVDARQSTVSHSPVDVRALVEELRRWAPSIRRMAVVTSSDVHYGLARMGSTLAEDAGIESGVFREYSDAVAYLDVERSDTLP